MCENGMECEESVAVDPSWSRRAAPATPAPRRQHGSMSTAHRHFAVAALFVARNAAYPSGGPKIDSHEDFDSTAAWRHHVSMPPSSRSQSAATTALTAGICELFRVKRLREIPHWWILGRCGPLNADPGMVND